MEAHYGSAPLRLPWPPLARPLQHGGVLHLWMIDSRMIDPCDANDNLHPLLDSTKVCDCATITKNCFEPNWGLNQSDFRSWELTASFFIREWCHVGKKAST